MVMEIAYLPALRRLCHDAIRIEVPKMDRFGEFAPQIDKARAGLLATSRLIELSHQIQL